MNSGYELTRPGESAGPDELGHALRGTELTSPELFWPRATLVPATDLRLSLPPLVLVLILLGDGPTTQFTRRRRRSGEIAC